MTTFATARGELVTAFASVGTGATSAVGRLNPPCVYIAGDGADTTHVLRGAVESTWRAVLVAGAPDNAASAGQLDTLKQAAIVALRNLVGWQVTSLGRDGVRTFGGNDYLSAELRGVRMIDL